MKKLFYLFLIILFFITGCTSTNLKEVVAKVDGKEITMQDLMDEIDNLPEQYRMYAQRPEIKRKILDNLIMTELLIKQAEKEGLLLKNEIQAKIKEEELNIKRELQAEIINLKRRLEKAGKTAKKDVLISELLKDRDFKEIEVSDDEIKNLYSQYSSNLKMQNPNAKVEDLKLLKDDIRKSIARDKWLNNLKTKANITVNESLFAVIPSVNNNLKIIPEGKNKK